MSGLRDASVFLTGASSGIGEALARELVGRGARIALVARRAERLESLRGELGENRTLSLVADVTVDGELEEAAKQTREAWGGIGVVIANAGFGVSGSLERLTLDDYRRQFETNVFGVLRTIYATLDDLKASRGRLVLIGSVAGHVALPNGSAYAMSKFSVRALAESLYHELKPKGVSVTLISPGLVRSELRHVNNKGVYKEGSRDPAPSWLVLDTETAARQIADAVERRERERVITGHGKAAVLLNRYAPSLVSAAMGLGLKKPGAAR